ncbi:MAG TPA: DUF3368 domain-containing protein [Anaerolineae bacterium]|nr:DUF3368 domain-containing protein [Anaerolineae bacterium]HRT32248.1 DUF3368 domain-containing protein [Anaerolineae bacterium]
MSLWVVDASPLIFLAKLERLDLLRQAAGSVCLPQAVADEIRAKPDMATQLLEQALQTWIEVRVVDNRMAVDLLLAELDLGEAEVIVLAKILNAEYVVMDDLDARRFARRVGLRPIGTLGLLLAARLRGEIPSLQAEIQRLEKFGFRASSALKAQILRAAGE